MSNTGLLTDVLEDIRKKYLDSKGQLSLEDIVNEHVEGIRKNLLEMLNEFKTASDYLGEKREGLPDDVQPGGILTEETKVHNIVHDEVYKERCPVVGKEVSVYMNLCQDFDELKAWCIGGFCPLYPALNRFPVAPLQISPKRGEGDVDFDKEAFNFKILSDVNLDEVVGNTFAEKLKNLRDDLVEKWGIQKAREVIKWFVDKVSKKKEVLRIADYEIEVPGKWYVVAVRGDRKISGMLKKAILYNDGSMVLKLVEGGESHLITDSDVQYIEWRD